MLCILEFFVKQRRLQSAPRDKRLSKDLEVLEKCGKALDLYHIIL
jgi:hypothetical protein